MKKRDADSRRQPFDELRAPRAGSLPEAGKSALLRQAEGGGPFGPFDELRASSDPSALISN
jgi:hypothetical protein